MRQAKERPMAIAMQRCKDLRREYQRIYKETVTLTSSSGKAYGAAGKLDPQLSEAYSALFELMPDEAGLAKGEVNELEKLFEFLETDIHAFRCGYWKAEYFTLLKKLKLHPNHSARVRNLALNYIEWPGYRREFRELSRLAILHADQKFVEKVKHLYEEDQDEAVRQKAKIMLYKVLNSSHEFRTLCPETKIKLNWNGY